MGMNNPLDVWILTIEEKDAQENAMFDPPPKTFDH
jgi:hypothetical protein